MFRIVAPLTGARDRALRGAVGIELFTVAWMLVEAAISLAAGVLAGSLLLVAFGLDSVVELAAGAILLWRLLVQQRGGSDEQVDRAEHLAGRLVAGALVLLCAYVLLSAVYGLLTGSRAEPSPLGIGISLAAALVMPVLFVRKRALATDLRSHALREEAASSLTCGYMALAVLVGLGLNALLGWWWAENIAALVFLYWLVQETREALEAMREEAEADDADEHEAVVG
jgi:divalent metal cation (Fe/Co/Zn/Cd) transporter